MNILKITLDNDDSFTTAFNGDIADYMKFTGGLVIQSYFDENDNEKEERHTITEIKMLCVNVKYNSNTGKYEEEQLS